MPTDLTSAPNFELDIPPMDRSPPTDTEWAAFAMGCFWGPEALFGALDGVVRTCVGYAGGTTSDPTYESIGDHIETVRVEFDPEQIDYGGLLERFWAYHDPTRTPFKRQYQPAIFPYTEEQAEQARTSKTTVGQQYQDEITTEIIEPPRFYRAETYHQKHKLRHHPTLMRTFRAMYTDEDTLADSPAAALVNGYVGGHRAPTRIEGDLPRLGLPSAAVQKLRTAAERRYE